MSLKGSTMTEKTASVHWEGPGKKGQGQISTETAALEHYPYGFASRFEDDRRGTNPEEILAHERRCDRRDSGGMKSARSTATP